MYDIAYKNTLAGALNITDLSLLDSVVGEEEFKSILASLGKDAYSPGKRLNLDKVDTFDFSNLDNNTFCANLHVHTNASDGLAEIEEILEAAVKIADENFKNKGYGFVLAVTDHDTVESARKALQILATEKEKYKNLKLVLGVELSTVATDFDKQIKTLDIHTLVYCINPFEPKLIEFLDNRRKLKFQLASDTLNKLKDEFLDLLSRLKINLTLEEAAKIHPMITKGQDEVSHHLKKYIFGKTLFSYYVDNNASVKSILNKAGVSDNLLSYEKPVYKYKSMFNNEKYFYIYKDALEKYLNFITENKHDIKLDDIPAEIEKALLKAKEICEKSHPSKGNKIQGFSVFEETLEFINTLDYGLVSIAHPARINVKYVDKDAESFFDDFWGCYKNYGKDRAYAYEKYYQAYTGKKRMEMLTAIEKSAQKYNLAYTGGIDSHGYGVCTRSPYL